MVRTAPTKSVKSPKDKRKPSDPRKRSAPSSEVIYSSPKKSSPKKSSGRASATSKLGSHDHDKLLHVLFSFAYKRTLSVSFLIE